MDSILDLNTSVHSDKFQLERQLFTNIVFHIDLYAHLYLRGINKLEFLCILVDNFFVNYGNVS